MSLVKVVLDDAGIQELLHSAEIMGYCESLASGVAARCGAGYRSEAHSGKKRCYVNVFTADHAAVKDNSENNTLIKALR